MPTTYLSLAISDTMFPNGNFSKHSLSSLQAKELIEQTSGLVTAVNPSHAATIDLINRKFDIALPVPKVAPKVQLVSGDTLIVAQANLPRLAEGKVHSQETVENAVINFSLWRIS